MAQGSVSTCEADDSGFIPERITDEGLHKYKESLARVAQQLASHEKQLLDSLMNKLNTVSAYTIGIRLTKVRIQWVV
jgi:hypothetical protein